MGEIGELASQTETNTEQSQEDELSKILHWQGNEAKNHYKLYQKRKKIHFSISIYSAPVYQALKLEVLNKTDKNPCPHGAYLPGEEGNKIYCTLHGDKCSKEKNSEQ